MKIIRDNNVKEDVREYSCPYCESIIECTEEEYKTEKCPCCGKPLNTDIDDTIFLSNVDFDDLIKTKGVDTNDKLINNMIHSVVNIMKQDITHYGYLTSPYYYNVTGNTIVAIVYDSDCDKWDERENHPLRGADWDVFVFKDYYNVHTLEEL